MLGYAKVSWQKSTFCSYLWFQNNTTNYETYVLKLKDVHYITFTVLFVTKNPNNEILDNQQQVTSRSLVNLYQKNFNFSCILFYQASTKKNDCHFFCFSLFIKKQILLKMKNCFQQFRFTELRQPRDTIYLSAKGLSSLHKKSRKV